MKKRKLKGTYASINLDHIVHNYKEASRLAGNETTVSCVVKSDAYGHGERQVVQALVENGLTLICVATAIEAIRLRGQFPLIDILILGYTPEHLMQKLSELDFIQSVGSLEEAEKLNSFGQVRVHIKVNTGMNRLGFSSDDAESIEAVSKMKNISICGIFTHLHSSDSSNKELTLSQFDKFNLLINELKTRNVNIGTRHICNSGGIINFKDMHLDMVREGIMLYGLYPSKDTGREKVKLRECMELRSFVAQILKVKKGEGVSYSHTFIASHDMKIAAVSLGYSDGVFRHISNKGEVIINDERRPIIGTVCMNMFMVDVTGMDSVKAEDEVIIFGRSKNQFISIDEVAGWAGTISYDIVCRTGYSVPRVFYKNGEMIECEQPLLIEDE